MQSNAILLVLLLASSAGGGEEESETLDGAALLQDIASVDALYSESLSIGGVADVGPHFMSPGDPGAKFKWNFTRSGEEMTLHRVRVGALLPTFVKQGDSQFATYDEEGNMRVPMLKEEIYHLSTAERFRCSRYNRLTCTPDGRTIADEPLEEVDFFPSDDARPMLPVNQVIWSSGRGFSKFLRECRDAKRDQAGMVEMVCNGFDSPGRVGTWKLVVDPRQSFVVLEASYTPDFKDVPSIVIKNTSIFTEGALVVAGSTAWKTQVGMPVETASQCEQASFSVDQELLEFGRRCKQDPGAKHTIARDHRTGKQLRIQQQDVSRSTDVSKGGDRTGNYFLLILGAHIVVGGLIWLIYRYVIGNQLPRGPE